MTPHILPWVCYRSWRVIEQIQDGERFRVSLRFDSAGEAQQFALAFGAELEVLEPQELRERVIAAASATVAAYARLVPG